MKPLKNKHVQLGIASVLLVASLICLTLFCVWPTTAQTPRPPRIDMPGGGPPPTPPPGAGSSGDSAPKGTGPWIPSEPLASAVATNQDGKTDSTNDVQLSFQGANVDMIVQWLAQTTGKTVVKHPQVQCQLTITSSKKVTQREAINIVYTALALEGFTAIESTKSILIVPEGKEPRMSPELINGQKDIPEGRRRLAKVFTLKHIQPTDIKDKIRNALTDRATIDIDDRNRQIMITDYNDNIRVVGELIEALDSETPQDLTVRMIPLKHIPALDLAKELAPLYQKMSVKSPKDAIDVAADERANSLIVFSSEASFNALEQLIKGLDTEDAQEKIMETFMLKNADAQDVAKQLQDLTQDSGINARYYYVYSSSGNQNQKKISVVADRRRNAVVVQASPTQMEGIRKSIRELDEPVGDDSLAPKIYKLNFVSAAVIEDVLNELFLKKTQQRSYFDYYYDEYYGSGSQTADRDVGRLYGKVRITSEPYSNTIIVTSNSKENLAVVEDVLKQLDVPSQAGESTLRVGLKFAKASVVAKNINILFARNGSPPLRGGQQQQQQQQNVNAFQNQQQGTTATRTGFDLEQAAQEESYFPWLGGQPDNPRANEGRAARPVSDLVDRVRAVPDERANAVMVSANVHFFPQIIKLINDLDAQTDQVLIEARLVEVSSDFLDKLGVRWSPDGTTFKGDDLDNSILAKVGGEWQQGFGGKTVINNPGTAAGATLLTPANLLAQIRSGVVDSTINLDFLVQFLRKTTDATVLAEPQINVRDNETGRLFVGQQVPIQTAAQNQGSIGLSQSFTYKDVGVILEVTPHINNEGDVELKIHAESSTVVPGITILGGAVFDTRTFRTDLRARNGETLVVGGIIQKQLSDTLRKTPILGSIPGVGWAFKKKDKSTREVELMVFLRPKVVQTTADARELMREIDRKAPLLRERQADGELDPKRKK